MIPNLNAKLAGVAALLLVSFVFGQAAYGGTGFINSDPRPLPTLQLHLAMAREAMPDG